MRISIFVNIPPSYGGHPSSSEICSSRCEAQAPDTVTLSLVWYRSISRVVALPLLQTSLIAAFEFLSVEWKTSAFPNFILPHHTRDPVS